MGAGQSTIELVNNSVDAKDFINKLTEVNKEFHNEFRKNAKNITTLMANRTFPVAIRGTNMNIVNAGQTTTNSNNNSGNTSTADNQVQTQVTQTNQVQTNQTQTIESEYPGFTSRTEITSPKMFVTIMNSYNTYSCSEAPREIPQIVNWFSTADNQTKFRLFCVTASSKDFCHIALSKEVLTMMQPLFSHNIYSSALIYYMYFGMTILYLEELIKKSSMYQNDRSVMTLDQARMLPAYTFNYIEYFRQFRVFHSDTTDKNFKWGLYDLETFRKRFEVFTGGVLNGINWDKTIITGSCLEACVIRRPTAEYFSTIEDEFNESYPSYQVLPNTTNHKELSDIDMAIATNDNAEFEQIVKQHFEVIKKNCPTAVLIENKRDFSSTFTITGCVRPIEIFRNNNGNDSNNMFPLVSRFHFPMVRGLYDGNNIYMTTSMVSTALSGIMIDYRWFTCNSAPVEKLLKYITRGYGIQLSRKEWIAMQRYVSQNKKWHNLKAIFDGFAYPENIYQIRRNKISLYYEQNPTQITSDKYKRSTAINLRKSDNNRSITINDVDYPLYTSDNIMVVPNYDIMTQMSVTIEN